MNLGECLKWAERELASNPERVIEARVLLKYVSDYSDAGLIGRSSEELPEDQLHVFQQLIAKRRTGVPIAYLTGNREFWSHQISVNTSVLIPRPETELLIELLCEQIKLDGYSIGENTSPMVIADLGTGSGAISIALASEYPYANIIAIDQSSSALDLAKENAEHYHYNNIDCRCGDWFEPMAHEKAHYIVSNPPYIDLQDPLLIDTDIAHEPSTALIASGEGYADLKFIIKTARDYLLQNGWLFVEHGCTQAIGVRAFFKDSGYVNISTKQDLSGQDRVTCAQSPDLNAGLV